jgi:LAO/AO transport system kinase
MMPATGTDRRALARTLSRIANASVAEVLDLSRAGPGDCRRIGITGAPGVGKSSLIARLARQRLRHPGELAIIAIDPTSPRSGGAILGDRIRMQDLADEPRVFIRSLASRVSQDGLSDNLSDILTVVESAGFVEVIVETVGVGQVSYAIRRIVDTNVLVLMPGEGDLIQAMKGGILETADIFVVNKADLPGTRRLAAELRGVVNRHGGERPGWTTPVIPIAAGEQQGIDQLGEAIEHHQAWLDRQDRHDTVLIERQAQHVGSLLGRRTAEIIQALPRDVLRQPLSAAYAAVVCELRRSCRPMTAADEQAGETAL